MINGLHRPEPRSSGGNSLDGKNATSAHDTDYAG